MLTESEQRHQNANEYADEMVSRSEWAALTMPQTPEAAKMRSLAWNVARTAYLELTS